MLLFNGDLFATPGPKIIKLTTESILSLGFKISVRKENHLVVIEFSGPRSSINSCPATKSGSYLLSPIGEELFVQITEIEQNRTNPKMIGYYVNNKNTMGVFFDYICNEDPYAFTKYEITSILEWLTTQSR